MVSSHTPEDSAVAMSLSERIQALLDRECDENEGLGQYQNGGGHCCCETKKTRWKKRHRKRRLHCCCFLLFDFVFHFGPFPSHADVLARRPATTTTEIPLRSKE